MSAKSFTVLALSALAVASPTSWFTKRQAVQPYQGCFTEGNGIRALKEAELHAANMTHSMCESFCTLGATSYLLWGTEYGSECYCGNTLEFGSVLVADAECNMACGGGVPGEICGAGNRLSVYGDADAIPPSALPNTPPPADATYLGCYTEGNGTRALPDASTGSLPTMSLDVCAQYCFDVKGLTILGMEYGSECWCGDEIDVSALLVADTECSMPCAGDATEFCGAGDRLSVWQKN